MARQRSQANSPQLGLRPGREQSQWDCGRADNSPSGTAAWQTPVLGPPDIRVRIHYRGRFVKSSNHCGPRAPARSSGMQHGHRASQRRRRAAGGNDSRGRSADLSHPYAAPRARRARVTSDVPDGWPTGGVEVSSRKAVSSSAQTPALSRGAHTVSPRSRMVRAAIRSDHDASGPMTALERDDGTPAPTPTQGPRGCRRHCAPGSWKCSRAAWCASSAGGPCPGRRSRTGLARRDTLRHEGGRSNAPTLRKVPDSTKADVSASTPCSSQRTRSKRAHGMAAQSQAGVEMGSLHRAGSAPVDSVVAPSTTGRELIPLSQRLPPGHARAGGCRCCLSGRRCSTRCGNGARSARRRPEFVRSQFLDHGVRRSGELSGRSRRSWSVGPRTRQQILNCGLPRHLKNQLHRILPTRELGDGERHSRLEHHVGPGTVDEIDARHPDKRRDAHRHDHSRACGAAAADPSARREHSDERASRGAYLAGSWVEPTRTASTLTHCRRRRRRRRSRAKGDLQIILGCFGTWERATAKGDLQIILPTDKGDLQIILRRR